MARVTPGVKGGDPLLSRILSVADAFDAMTNRRAYRKAIPPQKALDIIRKNAENSLIPGW